MDDPHSAFGIRSKTTKIAARDRKLSLDRFGEISKVFQKILCLN